MGTALSRPFDDPDLKGEKVVVNVKRGEDIILSWEANIAAYGQWMKGSQLLKNDDRISITQSDDYKHFTLTIRDARENDEGSYSLELWKFRDAVTGSIDVKLLEYDADWRTIHWQENERVKRFLREFKPSNPEVSHLRFLLCGPAGAGKSSIINSINCTFQGCITDLGTGQSHTKDNKTYNIMDQKGKELRFVFTEVKDLENKDGGALSDDITRVLKGHVGEGYEFNTASPLSDGNDRYNSSPSLTDRVHCLVNVVPADQIVLLNDNDSILVKMRKIRQLASDLGIPQVVFMTHVDICPIVREDLTHIYSSKKIEKLMQHCSNKLGVPMNCIFGVKNYDKEKRVDEQTDSLFLEALQTIVHYANDFIDNQNI